MANDNGENESTESRPYDPAQPLEIPPEIAAAFPPKGVLHASLWWSLQTTHAPAIFHVGAAVTFGVLEMARRGWWIHEDDPFVPAIWVILVGDSALGKSTVYKRYRRLYTAYLRNELGAFWKGAPLIEGEGTLQGLLAALSDEYNSDIDRTSALLMLDEFTRLLRSKEAPEQLCRLIDQQPIRRYLLGARREEQVTGKKVDGLALVNPAISGLFCTTPESLGAISDKMMVEGGLFSRLVWLKAGLTDYTPRPVQRIHEGRLLQVLEMWRDWASFLAGTEIQQRRIVKIPSEVECYLASELFEPLCGEMSEGNRLNPYCVRATNQVRTIAALYALSQSRAVAEIDDMERAIAFAYLYLGHTRKINKTTAVAPTIALAERIKSILAEHTPKWVYKKHLYRHTCTTKAELDSALELLLEQDEIERMTVHTGRRGRPGEAYRLVLSDQAGGAGSGDQGPKLADVIPFPGQVTGNQKSAKSDGDSEPQQPAD